MPRVVLALCLAATAAGCAGTARRPPSVRLVDDASGEVVASGRPPRAFAVDGARHAAGGRYRVVVDDGAAHREVLVHVRASGWHLGGDVAFGAGATLGWLVVDPATGELLAVAPEDRTVEELPAAPAPSPLVVQVADLRREADERLASRAP
jgi:hypothetical protein